MLKLCTHTHTHIHPRIHAYMHACMQIAPGAAGTNFQLYLHKEIRRNVHTGIQMQIPRWGRECICTCTSKVDGTLACTSSFYFEELVCGQMLCKIGARLNDLGLSLFSAHLSLVRKNTLSTHTSCACAHMCILNAIGSQQDVHRSSEYVSGDARCA